MRRVSLARPRYRDAEVPQPLWNFSNVKAEARKA